MYFLHFKVLLSFLSKSKKMGILCGNHAQVLEIEK